MISELPGALPEGMTGYDMIWNAYDAGLLANEFPGTVPLALWLSNPTCSSCATTTSAPVRSGRAEIRVSGSAAAAAVEALGATPVQIRRARMLTRCKPA